MLLTYNSLLVTRKTDVWGRRFSVLSTWSQLCDILWRICIHLLRTTRTKKDVGSTWEANLILGAESQMFWDPPIIGYFWQTTSSLIFFCQVLSGEFQAYLPQRMQPALGVKCPLTAAAPCALVTAGTAGVPAAGDSDSQHVSEARLPDFQACPFSRWLQGVKLF